MNYNLLTNINDIPEGWEIKRFEEIAKFSLGRTPPRNNTYYWNEKFFPWVSIKDMSDFGKIYYTKEFVSKKAYQEIFNGKFSPKETLLMSFKLTIGRTSILKIDAFHNEAIISIYPNDKIIDKYFLFYYLPTINFNQYFDKAIKGNTLNKSKIANLKIVIPPLSEQKAIAEVLQTIQEAKEKTEAVIEATRQLKKSMMKHLFTYGVANFDLRFANENISIENHKSQIENPKSQIKLKDTEIGPIPEHWQVVRLGEVAEIKYGKANPKTHGFIPLVGSGGIYGHVSKALTNKPTVIIGRKGTAGEVYFSEVPCYPSDTTFYLDFLSDLVYAKFLYYYMTENKISGEHAKTTLPSLQRTELQKFPIPLPPLPEQQAIAEILQAIDEKIEKEEAKKKALENLFKSMLNNLMGGRVRVKNLKEKRRHL
ncbi:MAG: restriction endonuclease subunit S [Candidatus Aenigmatarchaeota archaeon]